MAMSTGSSAMSVVMARTVGVAAYSMLPSSSNAASAADVKFVDRTGDGRIDVIEVDTTNNGQYDKEFTLKQ